MLHDAYRERRLVAVICISRWLLPGSRRSSWLLSEFQIGRTGYAVPPKELPDASERRFHLGIKLVPVEVPFSKGVSVWWSPSPWSVQHVGHDFSVERRHAGDGVRKDVGPSGEHDEIYVGGVDPGGGAGTLTRFLLHFES